MKLGKLVLASLMLILLAVGGCVKETTKYQLVVRQTEGGIVTSATGEYDDGKPVKITATPEEGYEFYYWEDENGNEIGKENPYTITMNSNKTIKAKFISDDDKSVIRYKLTLIEATKGSISLSDEKDEYLDGNKVTIIATAETGYKFSNWEDENGNEIGKENPYTITMNSDKTIKAIFVEDIKVKVTTETTTGGRITVTPNEEEYEIGTEITLKATVEDGYQFSKWEINGENKGSNLTIKEIVITTTAIKAYFSEIIIPEENGETTLSTSTPEVITLDLSDTEISNITNAMEATEDIFGVASVLKNNINGNETVGKVLDAVLLFEEVEEELTNSLFPEETASSVINRIARIPSKMIKRSEEDMGMPLASDIQDTIVTVILPKLNDAISKLKEAVELNQTIKLSAAKTGMDFTVEIAPSHLLFLESIMKAFRGVIYYGLAYNLDATEQEIKEFDEQMETMGYEAKLGDAIMEQFSEDMFTVKNEGYKTQSYSDIKAAISEFVNAVENMPEGNSFNFDPETYSFSDNINDYEGKEINVMVIPKSFKDELVKNIKPIQNILEGPAEITYDGYTIKLDLSVLFDNSVDIKSVVKEIMNHFSNSAFYENQDFAGLADETVGGLIPDGLKSTINSLLTQIKDNGENVPADWDELISADNMGLLVKADAEEKDFSGETITFENTEDKLYKVTGLTDKNQLFNIQIDSFENAVSCEKYNENSMMEYFIIFGWHIDRLYSLKNNDYLNMEGIDEETRISVKKIDVTSNSAIDINDGYTFTENMYEGYKVLKLDITEADNYKIDIELSEEYGWGSVEGKIYNSNLELLEMKRENTEYNEEWDTDEFSCSEGWSAPSIYSLDLPVGEYFIIVNSVDLGYSEEGNITLKFIKTSKYEN